MYRLEEYVMFTVGDKVVYPMHGAGIIESIEEKEILGQKKDYYIIKTAYFDMTVMAPVDSCDIIGIRSIVDRATLDKMLEELAGPATPMSESWSKRFKDNTDKLKTGRLECVTEVVRNLGRQEKVRKLSTGEKKMLINAKHILASEIMLVRQMTKSQASQIIEETI